MPLPIPPNVFLCPISVLFILHVWHLFLHAAGHWQWVSFQLPAPLFRQGPKAKSQPLSFVAWHFWHLQHLWLSADTHGRSHAPCPLTFRPAPKDLTHKWIAILAALYGNLLGKVVHSIILLEGLFRNWSMAGRSPCRIQCCFYFKDSIDSHLRFIGFRNWVFFCFLLLQMLLLRFYSRHIFIVAIAFYGYFYNIKRARWTGKQPAAEKGETQQVKNLTCYFICNLFTSRQLHAPLPTHSDGSM